VIKLTRKKLRNIIMEEFSEDIILPAKSDDSELGETEGILSAWDHQDAASYARALIKQFGPPDESSKNRLTWYSISMFNETVVIDESIPHAAPSPHRDFCYSTVVQHVPKPLLPFVNATSDSIIVDNLKGTVTARCGNIGANAITLNFVSDLVDGKIIDMGELRKKISDGEDLSGYNLNVKNEYNKRITGQEFPVWFKPEKFQDQEPISESIIITENQLTKIIKDYINNIID
jgi:hypothetical protein